MKTPPWNEDPESPRTRTAPPVDLNVNRPTPARMYDYFLGGKDNFDADRDAGDNVIAALGDVVTSDVVWENRHFLRRVVRHLAERGVTQFVDVGAGLPSMDNTHQVAQRVAPDARVVYVDYDPIVLAHGRALLADNPNTVVVTADMREPRSIIEHPDVRGLIDFERPVAILFVAVFHFIRETEDPAGIIAAFRERLAPGSYLVISHLTSDGPPVDQRRVCEDTYKNATSPMVFRSHAEITALFDGLDMEDPGHLVRPWKWHTDDSPQRTEWLYAGIGRTPDRTR